MTSHSNIDQLTDRQIIDLILQDGKSKYFELLYNRYHGRVKDKCFSLLKSRQMAHEFTLEIFEKVYEKLNTFKGNSTFSSWLYAISYNHCIEYLRQKKKLHYPEWNRNFELPDVIDEMAEEDLTGIRYDRLMKVLDMAHPEEKALLLMRYQDNIPLKLIQLTFRISESAAKMRIKRARARVMHLYKEMYNSD
jgi:RNA polymerase sigma factor (sigma-70 family)